MTIAFEWWNQFAGEWEIDVWKDPHTGGWISRVKFDTGMIQEEGKSAWEAVRRIKAQWTRMGISGRYQ